MSVPLTYCEDYVITVGTSIIDNSRYQNKIGAAWYYLEENNERDDITYRYHKEGKALRLVGGFRSPFGREVAEWIAANAGDLGVRWVGWGGRIWNNSGTSLPSWDDWIELDATVLGDLHRYYVEVVFTESNVEHVEL